MWPVASDKLSVTASLHVSVSYSTFFACNQWVGLSRVASQVGRVASRLSRVSRVVSRVSRVVSRVSRVVSSGESGGHRIGALALVVLPRLFYRTTPHLASAES